MTTHFSEADVEHSDYAVAHSIVNVVPKELFPKMERLEAELENVRAFLSDHYKDDVKMFTSSIYRCPALNKAVGGQPTSQHMILEACDFTTSHGTPEQVWNHIKESDLPYDQLILEHDKSGYTWVHYSVSHEGKAARHMAFKLEKK